MIGASASLLPALAIGWLLVRLLLPREAIARAWSRWLVEISLGAGIGLGLTSCSYFALLWAGLAGRGPEMGVEIVALAALAWLVYRRGSETTPSESSPSPSAPDFSWSWALRVAGALVLLMCALDFAQGVAGSPHGEWDAFSIWNLRAKFLAGGAATWRSAVSTEISAGMVGAGHPGYPLLLSASIARLWTITGEVSTAAPILLSALFTLATAGLLYGLLAKARAESAGLLAVMVLLATEGFISQAASQYADIPLGFYLLGTIALLARAEAESWTAGAMALAGLCIGFAPWTKNEGLPFALSAGLIAGWRVSRPSLLTRPILGLAAGAAPGILITAAFKLALAPPEAILPKTVAETTAKIIDPSRYLQIAAGFGKTLWEAGNPWTHPILLLAVLAAALGFVSKQEIRARMWLAVPLVVLLAADAGVYLVTTADLAWHLSTSANRLFAQFWPPFLFVFFLLLNPPVSKEADPEPESKTARPKKRQKAASRA